MTNIKQVLTCILFSVLICVSHWSVDKKLTSLDSVNDIPSMNQNIHITIALLSAPRYESRGEKELTRTILSIADEFESFTRGKDSNISVEIFLLNHFGESHVNLYETFDDFRQIKKYSFFEYMKQHGMILNDTDQTEEVFEFRGSETYYDQFKTRVTLPKTEIEYESFISQGIPLFFSYKEHYFPLKNAPIVFKQLQHVSSLFRETYYHMRATFSNNELENHYVLLLEDDFPFCDGYFEKMIHALRVSQSSTLDFCGLFMATGGSSILIKASLLPHLSDILKSEPTLENGRLIRMSDGSLSPIPQDVTLQSCLLGNWNDCIKHPILTKCKSTVSDRLFFRHIGEKSTDKFLKHAGKKWQCNWRNPLTSFTTMPKIIF